MKEALDAAVASLPAPVSSVHVKAIAETILRTAKDGERDSITLQRMAFLELQISAEAFTSAGNLLPAWYLFTHQSPP